MARGAKQATYIPQCLCNRLRVAGHTNRSLSRDHVSYGAPSGAKSFNSQINTLAAHLAHFLIGCAAIKKGEVAEWSIALVC